ASYVSASRRSYAVAAASDPPGPNCGCQKSGRFGSLPTITSFTPWTSFGIEAAYAANCARACGVSGVLPDSWYTATIGRIPPETAAPAAPLSAVNSSWVGAFRGGCHTELRTTAPKPARAASDIFRLGSDH